MVNKVQRKSGRPFQKNFLCEVFNVTFPVDVVRSATLEGNGVSRLVAEVFLEQGTPKETRLGKSQKTFILIVTINKLDLIKEWYG